MQFSTLDILFFLLVTALPLYAVLAPAAVWVALSPARFGRRARGMALASLLVLLPALVVSCNSWEHHPLIAPFADYRLRNLQAPEVVDGISMPANTTVSYRWGRPFLVSFIRPGMVGTLPVVSGAADLDHGTLNWHFYHEPMFQTAAEPMLVSNGCKYRKDKLPDGYPVLIMAKDQTPGCTKALGRP